MTNGLVLVAVDGSPGAAHALAWAAARARAAGARLRVVTAWDRAALLGIPAGGGIVVPSAEELVALGSKLLDEALESASLSDDVTVQRSIREGRAGKVVLAEAAEYEPDLVVVGTHGRTALARVLLGSVSMHVATHSTVPVAVVPAAARVDHSTSADAKRIRVGVDGSPGAAAALAWVADHTACPIELMHAWKVPHLYGVAAHSPSEIERGARAALTAMVESLPRAAAERSRIVVLPGDPREVLVDDTGDVAAIVVGRRRVGPLAALLGSVSTFVASHSEVPVLIVPPGPGTTGE